MAKPTTNTCRAGQLSNHSLVHGNGYVYYVPSISLVTDKSAVEGGVSKQGIGLVLSSYSTCCHWPCIVLLQYMLSLTLWYPTTVHAASGIVLSCYSTCCLCSLALYCIQYILPLPNSPCPSVFSRPRLHTVTLQSLACPGTKTSVLASVTSVIISVWVPSLHWMDHHVMPQSPKRMSYVFLYIIRF